MKNRLCVLMALLGLAFNASAASLGTAFTYQGRLNEGSAPANGLYDIRVSLYGHPTDEILAETAPNQNPYGIIGVGVTNGLFTTPLDFGPNAFTGPPRWLEIWVRTNFAGFWTVLTPRQELKPTPYALYATQAGLAGYATNAGIAGHAPWAGLTGLPAGFADGVDNDTTYLAGFGLGLSSTTFSLNLSQTDARYWTTVGNGGAMAGTHFLGTTDDHALVFKVNSQTAFRLEPTFASPNLVGGHAANVVSSVSDGSAVLSGGTATDPNGVDGARSVVVGGHGNTNAGAFSFLGGGAGNALILANHSVLVGGSLNRLSDGAHGFLGGGEQNELTGFHGVVSGGNANTNGGSLSTIAGGSENTIRSNAVHATISGGYRNTISTNSAQSTISGGYANAIEDRTQWGTIGGGQGNIILRFRRGATISGGERNGVGGEYGAIGGGDKNGILYGWYSTVGGGHDNDIVGESANYATIAGGAANLIESASGATIGGGGVHVIESRANYATIGGGYGNKISTNADYATVAGGTGNHISLNAANATIGGGSYNTIATNATSATIGGGSFNTIATNATRATIPGGRGAVARSYGQHVYASGAFFHSGDSQASLYVMRALTSDSIQGELSLSDVNSSISRNEAIYVPEGSVWTFRLQASALQEGGAELASYEASGVVTHLPGSAIVLHLRDGAGNTIGTAKPLFETAGAIPWQVTPYVAGTGEDARLRIAVNGAPGQGNIRWVASVYSTELMR